MSRDWGRQQHSEHSVRTSGGLSDLQQMLPLAPVPSEKPWYQLQKHAHVLYGIHVGDLSNQWHMLGAARSIPTAPLHLLNNEWQIEGLLQVATVRKGMEPCRPFVSSASVCCSAVLLWPAGSVLGWCSLRE